MNNKKKVARKFVDGAYESMNQEGGPAIQSAIWQLISAIYTLCEESPAAEKGEEGR